MRFGRDLCGYLAQAERREWWLSNGLEGYAAVTIAGSLTRPARHAVHHHRPGPLLRYWKHGG